jgi:hypothetical protein
LETGSTFIFRRRGYKRKSTLFGPPHRPTLKPWSQSGSTDLWGLEFNQILEVVKKRGKSWQEIKKECGKKEEGKNKNCLLVQSGG